MTTRNVSDSYIKTFEDKNEIPDSFEDIVIKYINDTFNKFNININKYPNYCDEMGWSFCEQDAKQTSDGKHVNIIKMYYIENAPYIIVTVIKINEMKYVFNVFVDISGIEFYEQHGSNE